MVTTMAALMERKETISTSECFTSKAMPRMVAKGPRPEHDGHGQGHEGHVVALLDLSPRCVRHRGVRRQEELEANEHDAARHAYHVQGHAEQAQDDRPEEQEEEHVPPLQELEEDGQGLSSGLTMANSVAD